MVGYMRYSALMPPSIVSIAYRVTYSPPLTFPVRLVVVSMLLRRFYTTIQVAQPFKGYRYVEVIGFDNDKVIVQITSGHKFSVYADELEDA